ncbi:hypothetical protein [Pseudoalteromonas sp. NZS37]|uniref:hypothetical protein n=1 Tax=Pseudoalteromonas sp. NZS37 TaxID=2792071 RepID=UPI0018CD08AA|nr:hypothetical protein [Pseudoalteromonas sp. NZS37]MBG9992317.1 hypothetical protein [Pseudoalteromonas sp. NZS37]
MNNDDKTEQLIILLTRETYSGHVSWNNEAPPLGLSKGTDDFYPLFLQAEFKGSKIGLYQRRYKHFYDEFKFHWGESIGMCVIDGESVLWNFTEKSSALINLFDAARDNASNIGGILDNLLG